MSNYFTRLPVELKQKIFGEENFKWDCDKEEEHHTSLRHGSSMALVCRDWVEYGRTLILRRQRMYIQDSDIYETERSERTPRNAWESITRYPHLGAYVERLDFTVLLWKRLGFARKSQDSRLPGFHAILPLTDIDDIVERNFGLFLHLLTYLNRLEGLSLDSVPCSHLVSVLSAVAGDRLERLSWIMVPNWDKQAPSNQFLEQLSSKLSRHRRLAQFSYHEGDMYPPLAQASTSRYHLSGDPLGLTDMEIGYVNHASARFFLLATSKSTLVGLSLHAHSSSTACLLGIIFENVENFLLYTPTRLKVNRTITVDPAELLLSFPNLIRLGIATELDDFEQAQLHIELKNLLQALPMTLESLNLSIPSCTYEQNFKVIDAFWKRKARPNLKYWLACEDELDNERRQIDVIQLLKGEENLDYLNSILTASKPPLAKFPSI